jgi:hypothetical protein
VGDAMKKHFEPQRHEVHEEGQEEEHEEDYFARSALNFFVNPLCPLCLCGSILISAVNQCS